MTIIGPCAGIGSRLRPFTLSKPKTFINVAGKTVLEHILNKFGDTFDSDTELILIVGYKKRQITEFVKQKYSDKFKLTFIEQEPRGYNDDVPFYWGLGEAVYLANTRFEEYSYPNKKEDKKNGSLIFLADMIPIEEYSYLMYRYYESDVDGIITVMEVPEEDAGSYGVVVVDKNSFIQKLIEKPKDFVSNLAIAGIYAFSNSATKALFNILKGYLNKRTESTKEIYLTESLQDLINIGFKIAAINLKKGILDFGRPSEVLKGNKYLLGKQSIKVEDFKELNIISEKSYIKNPVYIGENSKILNSVIGPFVSIGANSVVENCILENCVIERNASLKNVISEKSIIGSNVNVENISKNNLIIGDKSIY
ncbi:MAG: sugar phosphate nucleotidyltransferase [Candidatus Hermodarchaeota archaeon]